VAVALNLYAVPSHVPFLDTIARTWLGEAEDPLAASHGLILLPTRRSARALAEAFLRVRDGRPTLLPRITAIGALDEAPLTLAGALDLPPAVEPMQRLAALTRLILALDGQGGAPRSADGAWRLARELASLMDEADRAGINLREKLPDAADPAFADHWAQTLRFLRIVTDTWPAWLADNGVIDPTARGVALLDAQAAAWEAEPPDHRVLVAGVTAAIPAVVRLLRVVAGMPGGGVVLPQLDLGMAETVWQGLEPPHAQAGLAELLAGLQATRGDVRMLSGGGTHGVAPGMSAGMSPGAGPATVPAARFGMLSRALLPAAALDDWMDRACVGLEGLYRLTPSDQQQEALGIALVLREALETPGARAALVTPDRDLAGRVTAALLRFGIVADDSAGEKLAQTPPAVFLRLLVQAVAEDLAPVPLLALLKHPLSAAGLTQAACRDAARGLESLCLRGPRPAPGFNGLRQAADKPHAGHLRAFLSRLQACLEPALRFDAAMAMPAGLALNAVIEAAERLAATQDTSGAHRLWGQEEGEALAETLSAARDAAAILPDLPRRTLPGLLDAILEGAVVRSRRALRGRDGFEHPRVFIWGLLEARLQSADVIVLGGLAEGIWPPAPEPGPWLSRPMRAKVGLPSPESAVGQAAHDFVSACCAAATVVLSCPARRDGAPAVPARWLTRLDAFLAGRDLALPEHPASAWARAMDLPSGPPVPVRPPQPRPPPHLRPRKLSVTAVETWLRDPYAIYARHILRLQALAPLDQATDAADYGSIVHDGLHRFLRTHGAEWPSDCAARLCQAMAVALAEAGLRPALQAWWAPRLARIAEWVADTETGRRRDSPPLAIASEVAGGITLSLPGGAFHLHGRADRIERHADGALVIVDYKTGRPPSQTEVDAGLAPQLLLEAAIAAEAGFGDGLEGAAASLVYWHLTGGIDAGKAYPLFKKEADRIPAAVAAAREKLCALIDAFDRPERAYLSRPHPARGSRFSDYEQLARVAEWAWVGDGDE
jgi:ATP-dependent helicase/nuclease subunit B